MLSWRYVKCRHILVQYKVNKIGTRRTTEQERSGAANKSNSGIRKDWEVISIQENDISTDEERRVEDVDCGRKAAGEGKRQNDVEEKGNAEKEEEEDG